MILPTLTCKSGHMNDDTVQYILETLPSSIKKTLDAKLRTLRGKHIQPELVSNLLSQEITKLDKSLISGLMQLFHRGRLTVEGSSDETCIKAILNGGSAKGMRYDKKIAQALGGCTVLFALVSPRGKELWLANLGDSYAGARIGLNYLYCYINKISFQYWVIEAGTTVGMELYSIPSTTVAMLKRYRVSNVSIRTKMHARVTIELRASSHRPEVRRSFVTSRDDKSLRAHTFSSNR